MLRLAITGCTGRMGKALIQAVTQAKEVQLSGATVHPRSPFIGREVSVINAAAPKNVRVVEDLIQIIHDFDILIDFTKPDATLHHIELCQAHNKGIIVGTTGFTSVEKQTIVEAAKEIPIVFSPNMSIGVNLCFALIKQAAKVLTDADIHISEAHHKQKKDSPSGTALEMGAVIKQVMPKANVGFSSIRAGDIVGDHTAIFALEGERIELTHRASNRANFAVGAIRAAKWLSVQKPGLYTMANVLGFE